MLHVVGNAAIDTVFQVDRFPLPGETVVASAMVEDIGGKGANQAVVAARAGASVHLIAAVGDDDAAQQLRDVLRADGVGIDGLVTIPGPTDRSSIYVDANGENTIVSFIGAARAFDPLTSNALGALASDDVVLCQGNLMPGVLASCLTKAQQAGARTVLNPSPAFPSPDFDWSLADLLVLNRVEATLISGQDDPKEAARWLRSAGSGSVVVTLGRDGAFLVGDGESTVAAPAVIAVDTTGAGDAFCGVLAAMWFSSLPRADALAVATEAAALAVTRRGVHAAFPTVREIQSMKAKQTKRGGR